MKKELQEKSWYGRTGTLKKVGIMLLLSPEGTSIFLISEWISHVFEGEHAMSQKDLSSRFFYISYIPKSTIVETYVYIYIYPQNKYVNHWVHRVHPIAKKNINWTSAASAAPPLPPTSPPVVEGWAGWALEPVEIRDEAAGGLHPLGLGICKCS